MPDLQAIGGRIGKNSSGVAVVQSGMDRLEELVLQKSPVAVEATWGKRLLAWLQICSGILESCMRRGERGSILLGVSHRNDGHGKGFGS